MVCNRSWHLPGNPKLVWHPARLIKEGGCVDLSVDTLHLKDPLVLFGSEGSALSLPLFHLSHRIIMLCHCSSTVTKDHFLVIFYITKWPSFVCRCASKPSFTHRNSVRMCTTTCTLIVFIITYGLSLGYLRCHKGLSKVISNYLYMLNPTPLY